MRDAHEFLLSLLADFQTPVMQRRHQAKLGDTAFSDDEDKSIIFTRGNLVASLGSSTPPLLSVLKAAMDLDRVLAEIPDMRKEPYAGRLQEAVTFSSPEIFLRKF